MRKVKNARRPGENMRERGGREEGREIQKTEVKHPATPKKKQKKNHKKQKTKPPKTPQHNPQQQHQPQKKKKTNRPGNSNLGGRVREKNFSRDERKSSRNSAEGRKNKPEVSSGKLEAGP